MIKTVRDTDWENVLGKQPAQTIKDAVKQAFHMRSPEIAQSLRELEEVPGIANVSQLSGINFANSITHYGHLWTGSQAGALTIDSVDKLDSVLNHFDIGVPGYDWLKEHATHALA